jgi:uncharacterized membrane protein YfcA
MVLLEYWYLFPISVVIATTAMASGISGAVFLSPLFIIVLGLEPSVAFGTALITQLFGFMSGVWAYARRRLIDFKIGRRLLSFSVPLAIVGSTNADALPPNLLKGAFGVGIIFIGWQMYLAFQREQREVVWGRAGNPDSEPHEHESLLVDRSGTEYRYSLYHEPEACAFAALGGLFLGMISVGLSELEEYHFVVRCRIPPPVAVGTSIFIVMVTVLIASAGHFYNFATNSDPAVLRQVLAVVTFTIPGVIVGGQIGPHLQPKLDPGHVKLGLSALFAAVGILMLSTLA